MKYIPRLLPYMRPHWLLAAISVLATVLDSGAAMIAPWPLSILVDSVLGNHPLPSLLASHWAWLTASKTHLLIFAVVAGLVATLISSAVGVLGNYVNTKLEQHIILDFRCDLFQHAQELGLGYHDQRSYGRMMYGVTFESEAAGGLLMSLQPLAQSALTLVGMFWIALRIDAGLALLSLTVLPLLYYSVGYYARNIQGRLWHVKGMESGALSIIHDALSMVRVVISFAREQHEGSRYRAQGTRSLDARVDVTVRQTVFTLTVNMITSIGTALVLGFGAYHALEGKLTVGQLLVIMSYIASVYKPLEAISYTVGSLQDRFVALGMAFSIMDAQPDVREAPHAHAITRARGQVTLEGVQFSYPGREDTLDDISFDVQAGQVVAIVGQTGAGKTTLMSLIPRFYDPSAGRVLLDGTDIRDLTLASLRGSVSVVPQEPVLFSGTVADNIRYGRLSATTDEIIEAAKDANAHDFITRLPEGYDTEVGERGAKLSGGERQRICVARAFIKDAPILILDEPTSSIDSRTEGVILDALDRLMVGRTTFIIAHRLSTIRHADLILVMDRGRLVEQGSHAELLEQDGIYRQLHDVQTGQRRQRLRLLGEHHEGADETDTDRLAIAEENETMKDLPALAADYACDLPQRWQSGEIRSYEVKITNLGTEAWEAGGDAPVRLGVHFGDGSDYVEDGWLTDQRFYLAGDVPPGACTTVAVDVGAPAEPGDHVLRHRMVKENVAWFDQIHRTTVSVLPDAPSSPARSHPKADYSEGRAAGERAPLGSRHHSSGTADGVWAGIRHQNPVPTGTKIVLFGLMTKFPVPGVIWQTVHYLVGLARLGYDVYYVEAHACAPHSFMKHIDDDGSVRAAAFIADIMDRFDLRDRWAYQALHADGRTYGMSESQLQQLYRSAALLINLHGGTLPRPEHHATGRLVYLETDPVAAQIELHDTVQETIDFLSAHCAWFTFAENYGHPDCQLPISDRFAFRPTRQPIIPDFWQPYGREGKTFTTIASWRQLGREVTFRGQVYQWSKHFEFLKFLDLPERTGGEFELALARHDDDARLLSGKGWRLREALGFGTDIDRYRHYIAESRGEFSVAKDQNVRLRSGWFSDRSATYLAAGRPVITQETGFSNILPTGTGLFAFSTMEEIEDAVAAINADYGRHSRAALEIAQNYFSYEVVLTALLAEVGLTRPAARVTA